MLFNLFNLSYVGEIFCIESERTVFEFRKHKETFCVVFTYSVKRANEISKFHVAVVQRWLKNVQKSVMHVQSCCFANINLLLFCHSRCLYRLCCLSTLLLWSEKFATMVTWRHASPLYSSVICKENKAIREITTLKEDGHKILWVFRIPLRNFDHFSDRRNYSHTLEIRGEKVLPYISHICMYRPKGKGFCALLVWKQVQTLPIWNRVRFSRKLVGRSVWTYLPVSIPNEVERKTITRIRNGFWEIFFVLSFSSLLHFQLKKRKSFLFYSLFNFLPKRFSTNSRLNACYTDYLFIYF